jgi:general L-amino acid transport system permease protein
MAARSQASETSPIPAFLRDIRVLQIIGQIVFVLVVALVMSQVMAGVLAAMAANNMNLSLAFLQDRAGFDITPHPEWYSSNSSYGQAFLVGLMNTLRTVSIGLVLTTTLGLFMGIFLLSSNWLVRHVARVYVEVLRNTPLLVQLFVWYTIVIFALPEIQQSIALPAEGVAFIPLNIIPLILVLIGIWLYSRPYAPERARIFRVIGSVIAILFFFFVLPPLTVRAEIYPAFYLSIRGFVSPELLPTARFADWLAFVAVGVALAWAMWGYFGRQTELTGRTYSRGRYALVSILGFAILGWIFVGIEPTPEVIPVQQEDGATVFLTLEEARASETFTAYDEAYYSSSPLVLVLPEQRRNASTGRLTGFNTGSVTSPEYVALLAGLVVYTSAFIADIVRAGIRAVSYGQVEAARSLGMSTAQTLRMIVLPQALRVIIPPLGNQYLNLAKNSSLATVVAYGDLFHVTKTIMNQSGQSVTGMVMVMLTYLAISLTIAAATNWFNRQFQIVTR